MKKIFGILLQLLGLITIVASCVAVTQLDCERQLLSEFNSELNYSSRTQIDSQQIALWFTAAFGIILFIIGLILLVTKTSRPRQKEAELTTYKYLVENGVEEEDTIESLERIFQLKQKGILSEEEFIAIKKKMME